MDLLDRFFRLRDRGSTVETEVRGGLATFFTMAYIVVLNPIILASAKDVTGARLNIGQLTTSTALVAAVMTVLMGVVGKYPFALAAGLGLNGVVAFQLAGQMSWEAAMGVVVIEGIAITILVVTGFRERIFDAIPLALKQAISVGIAVSIRVVTGSGERIFGPIPLALTQALSVGIGLFIGFMVFVVAGFIRRNPDAAGTPVPVGLGVSGRLLGWPTVVFVVGLLL